jgi:hypothetical protein
VTANLIRTEDSGSRFRIGGRPDAPLGFRWPRCRQCGGALQFLAQLALPDIGITSLAPRDQFLLLFQCQNEPGMCDEWDPNAGGNAACLVTVAAARPVTPAADPVAVAVEATDAPLGFVGGDPEWIQGDETPMCSCGAPMRFVAQLSDAGGGGISFGDAGEGHFRPREVP